MHFANFAVLAAVLFTNLIENLRLCASAEARIKYILLKVMSLFYSNPSVTYSIMNLKTKFQHTIKMICTVGSNGNA